VPIFEEVITSLSKETVLEKERVHRLIQQLAEAQGVPLVKIAQPIRVALTGKTASPPIDEVIEILGRDEVIQRLRRAIKYIEESQ
jgi:glutamyl-tRNA synthetase